MSNRESSGRVGATVTEQTLHGLAKAIGALARRVARIESSNRTVPPGLRFDLDIDDDGTQYLVVERVRTGNRERISGPL